MTDGRRFRFPSWLNGRRIKLSATIDGPIAQRSGLAILRFGGNGAGEDVTVTGWAYSEAVEGHYAYIPPTEGATSVPLGALELPFGPEPLEVEIENWPLKATHNVPVMRVWASTFTSNGDGPVTTLIRGDEV